jgi:Trm5-related predicted tRNA methylase
MARILGPLDEEQLEYVVFPKAEDQSDRRLAHSLFLIGGDGIVRSKRRADSSDARLGKEMRESLFAWLPARHVTS